MLTLSSQTTNENLNYNIKPEKIKDQLYGLSNLIVKLCNLLKL